MVKQKHSGGKIGEAARKLASNNSTKTDKKKASKTLNDHKKDKH